MDAADATLLAVRMRALGIPPSEKGLAAILECMESIPIARPGQVGLSSLSKEAVQLVEAFVKDSEFSALLSSDQATLLSRYIDTHTPANERRGLAMKLASWPLLKLYLKCSTTCKFRIRPILERAVQQRWELDEHRSLREELALPPFGADATAPDCPEGVCLLFYVPSIYMCT
jgi:hypothetical protein